MFPTPEGGAVVRVLGRFGDTQVTPGVLRQVSDGQAALPAGTVDVQFRVPVSLSLLLEAMSAAGRRAEVDTWAVGCRDLVVEVASSVQDAGGYALESADTAVPARLDLATTIHEVVPGIGTRWHSHVWVAPTALTIAEGEYRPVAVEVLTRKVWNLAWPTYIRKLEKLSQRTLGVRWGEPRPAAVREIVDPPWHEYVGPAERGVCAQPAGPARHLVLADDQTLRLAAEMERSHQIAMGQGTADPPVDDPAATRAALMRGLMSRAESDGGRPGQLTATAPGRFGPGCAVTYSQANPSSAP